MHANPSVSNGRAACVRPRLMTFSEGRICLIIAQIPHSVAHELTARDRRQRATSPPSRNHPRHPSRRSHVAVRWVWSNMLLTVTSLLPPRRLSLLTSNMQQLEHMHSAVLHSQQHKKHSPQRMCIAQRCLQESPPVLPDISGCRTCLALGLLVVIREQNRAYLINERTPL